MKKTLIALTLAALPVASMAEVVLYGQIKGGVEVTKEKGVKGTVTNIVDYGSRIGFKGQEQLNNNLKAIWQLEQKVDIAGGTAGRGFGTRDSFAGLQGGFGTVKAGYFHNPLGEVNGELDTWEYDSNAAGLGVFTRTNDATKRRVAVGYETPDLAGFTAKAYVSPSDNNRNNDNNATTGLGTDNRRIDRALYGLGASYKNNGFFADVAGAYVKNGENNIDVKANGKKRHAYQAVAQAGYNANNVLVGLAYQQARNVDNLATLTGWDESALIDVGAAAPVQAEDIKVARVQEVAATGAYTFNDNLTLKGSAAYGFNIKDVAGNKFGNGKYVQGILGADYNLSKRTQLNSQVGYLQFGKKDENFRKGTVGVGLKHKF